MHADTAEPTIGRRRRLIEADDARPADPWDQPQAATQATGPIADAIRYGRDRLDRVEHVLGDLNGAIERLGYDLRPVLTGGGPPELPGPGTLPRDPQEADRRSTVARQVTALGDRADELANIAGYLRDKVVALVEGLELTGIDH